MVAKFVGAFLRNTPMFHKVLERGWNILIVVKISFHAVVQRPAFLLLVVLTNSLATEANLVTGTATTLLGHLWLIFECEETTS